MYQIFVVEDELLIRQSIRRVIEGMQGPYAFCGEASDGEMALSMMQDLMPDILVTDIRMPFLDGFELVSRTCVGDVQPEEGVHLTDRYVEHLLPGRDPGSGITGSGGHF